jgi:hypothetical protein
MTMPPPFIQGGSRHRAAEALQEAVKEAYRESGTGVTGGRRPEAHARPRGQMTTGGMAMPHLPQEARHGGDRRQHAVAPCGRPRASAWTRSATLASRRDGIPTPVENVRHRPTARPFPPPPPRPPHAAHGRLQYTLLGWRRAWVRIWHGICLCAAVSPSGSCHGHGLIASSVATHAISRVRLRPCMDPVFASQRLSTISEHTWHRCGTLRHRAVAMSVIHERRALSKHSRR